MTCPIPDISEQSCHWSVKIPRHHQVPPKTHEDGEATIGCRRVNAPIDGNLPQRTIIEARTIALVLRVVVRDVLWLVWIVRAHKHGVCPSPLRRKHGM